MLPRRELAPGGVGCAEPRGQGVKKMLDEALVTSELRDGLRSTDPEHRSTRQAGGKPRERRGRMSFTQPALRLLSEVHGEFDRLRRHPVGASRSSRPTRIPRSNALIWRGMRFPDESEERLPRAS
jgi:hypothetical protein